MAKRDDLYQKRDRETYFAEAELTEAKRTGAIMRELRYKPEFPMDYPDGKRNFLFPQELTPEFRRKIDRLVPDTPTIDPYYGISKLRILYELAGRRLAGYMFVIKGVSKDLKNLFTNTFFMCSPGLICTDWYYYTRQGRQRLAEHVKDPNMIWACRVRNNITPMHPDPIIYMNFILGYPYRWFLIKYMLENDLGDVLEHLRPRGVFYAYSADYAEEYWRMYEPGNAWMRDWICSQTGTAHFKPEFLPTWRDMEHDLIYTLNRFCPELSVITGITIITTDEHGSMRITTCESSELEELPPEREYIYTQSMMHACVNAAMVGLPFATYYAAREYAAHPLMLDNKDMTWEKVFEIRARTWKMLSDWFSDAYGCDLPILCMPDIPDEMLELASVYHPNYAIALACGRRIAHGKPVPEDMRKRAIEYMQDEFVGVKDPGVLWTFSAITGYPHRGFSEKTRKRFPEGVW